MACLPYWEACAVSLNTWGRSMMVKLAQMDEADRAKRSRAAKLGWRRRRKRGR